MKKMTVSVIIPCFNGEEYIGKTLKGVFRQTYRPTEVIVVDDGSTDNSVSIVKQFKRAGLITHPKNLGLAQARNTGLKKAKSEIVVYLDHDAIPDPKLIEKLLKLYTPEKIAGVGGQGIESNIRNIYDRWRKIYGEQTQGKKINNDVDFIIGICSSYRKRVLEKVGGFDPRFRTNAEDFEMGLKIREGGYKLVYTPRAKVYHQKTDSLRSLLKTGFNYTYWGKIAHSLHQGPLVSRPPSSILSGIIKRISDDLFKHKSIRLAILTILMFLMECKAQVYFIKYKAGSDK